MFLIVEISILRSHWVGDEAPGVISEIAVSVVRSLCDDGDKQTNKTWYSYAVAMAAAYARELLLRITSEGKSV